MEWFEKLTGFTEKNYTETKENLYIKDNKLYSKINHNFLQKSTKCDNIKGLRTLNMFYFIHAFEYF